MAPIGGMTGTDAMALTAGQLKDSMKSFALGMKGLSDRAVQAEAGAVSRIKGSIGGIVEKRREQAGLTSESMINVGLGESPLMAAMAGGGVDIFKSMMGGEDEKEDEDRTAEDPKGPVGDAILEQKKDTSYLEKISKSLVTIKGLVDRIEMSVRDSNKITIAEGKRAQKNQARKRSAAIEAQREAGVEGAGGEDKKGMLSGIGGMTKRIPGFQMLSGLFAGGLSGITAFLGPLLLPITMIVGVISFVTGFMKGYEEGGIIEGITQGFESLINNLVDVPLNFLKDVVAWIAGALGFEEVETLLNDFDFDIASMVRPVIDWFVELGEKISGAFTAATDYVSDKWDAVTGFFSFGGDDEEEAKEPKPTPKSKATAKKELSKDEQMLQDVDPATGVPKVMLKKYKDEYIEDEDERGRLGAMYRTQNSPTGAKTMWDKENKQYKTDKRTDAQRNLENEIDSFNRAATEEQNSPEMVAKRQADMDRENAKLRAEYEAEMRATDPRAGAAASIQDAGIAAGGGGGPIVIPAPAGGGGGGSGGGGPIPMPMPLEIRTDPTLSAPAQ